MPAIPTDASLRVSRGVVSRDELSLFNDQPLLSNFDHFGQFGTPQTEPFWVRVEQGGRLAAIVPVVRLVKRRATDMLRLGVRRWLGPVLGPLAKKTTLLLDTALLAYDDASPFFDRGEVDSLAVKQAVCTWLKQQKKVDAVWITEPESEAAWAAGHGFQQFHTLPMVHVETAGFDDLDQYVERLSKKRRRNFRQERETFAAAGGEFHIHRGPLYGELLDRLLKCLAASAARSQFTVPYNDVLTDPQAFAEQRQTVLTAVVDGEIVGFMSFVASGEKLLQCHGGLDYHRSHEVLAYHNLIYRAIEYAIEGRFERLSMGPLNNETKRRAATTLRPMVASLWNRLPGDRIATKLFFAKNFEVYRGEADEEMRDK